MHNFENVNYTFYKGLGRAAIPDEQTFNEFKLENVLQMQQYIDDGLITEKVLNGIDSAVCLWIEEDYKADQLARGAAGVVDASETIGAYSHSINTKAYDKAVEMNAKSKDANKYKWLGLYCYITTARG